MATSLSNLGDNRQKEFTILSVIIMIFFLEYESVKNNFIKYKCLSCVRHRNRPNYNQHFKIAVFHNEFTLCQIKPNIYYI